MTTETKTQASKPRSSDAINRYGSDHWVVDQTKLRVRCLPSLTHFTYARPCMYIDTDLLLLYRPVFKVAVCSAVYRAKKDTPSTKDGRREKTNGIHGS